MTQVAKARRTDGHVHLRMIDGGASGAGAGTRPPWDWARWPVLLTGVAAVGLFAASFFLPWWRFWLYAPQYPSGLRLVISLTGMGGDVAEIDLLNHYIGMKHLAGAAPLERQLAGWGVAAISVLTLASLAVSGRRLNKLLAVPAISFPVLFVADSFYWLYSFGHQLDPKAPLHIDPFTPQMFGNGQIGQFETFARPDVGFWLAVLGVVFAVVATFLRSRVCSGCAHAGSCRTACPRLMVLPATQPRERTAP